MQFSIERDETEMKINVLYQQGQETHFEIGSQCIDDLRQWKAIKWLVG